MRKKKSWEELCKEIEEAKKDPKFMESIDQFIKMTTGPGRMKDCNMKTLKG